MRWLIDRGRGVQITASDASVRLGAVGCSALIATLPLSSLAVGQTTSGAPPAVVKVAAASVCRPTFMKDGRPSPSGTGFILHAPALTSQYVLVSAHHLFGMATATTTGMPWQDVPRRVISATCRSFDGTRTWRTSAAVAIPTVRAFWHEQDIKDIAILPVVAGPPTTLGLSSKPAAPGDIVYVLAQVEHPLPTDGYVHRARVVPSSGFLGFFYDEPGFRTANISGAPVVSAEGKVVGVNVGAGHAANGALVGVADDLPTIEAALSAAPPP